MMTLRKLDQRGDTLVEVLIAMALMSLVLVGAYVSSNKNSASLQGSQEREQAQRLVAAQIEMLRLNNGISGSNTCFNTSTGAPSTTCSVQPTQTGTPFTMQVVGPDPTTKAYAISATWTSLGSKVDGDSNVTMYYRLN